MNRRVGGAPLLVALLLLMSVPLAPATANGTGAPIPTWGDCWFGDKAGSLSASEQISCADHYSEPPTHRLYDLRWVFLNVSAADIPANWTEVQLANLNGVFAPWDFQFQTKEEVVIPNGVAESNDYYAEWSVRDFLPDLRAQLNLSADEETALAELKAELAARHVSQEELDNITLDAEFNTGGAARLASRARSESITILVRPNLDASGRSSGPSPEFHTVNGGLVELKTTMFNGKKLTTLPHEMGHYFGISHTHAPDYDTAEADFGFAQRWSRMASGGEAARRVFGDDWSEPLGQPYLAWNDSEQEMVEFKQLMQEAYVWPIWEFLYRGDHQSFNGLAEFVTAGEANETIWRTNFERNPRPHDDEGDPYEWWGMNCIWNSIADRGECRYHEDPVLKLNHTHPTLNGTIFFENGTVSNLMSYITPPYENLSSRRGITQTQLDMIRFTANAPLRLLLRNHCLGSELCGPDDPDDDPANEPSGEGEDDAGDSGNQTGEDGNGTGNQTGNNSGNWTCTDGDSVPAADGCNTCTCWAGNWSCTEIGCGDEEPDDGWSLPGISLLATLGMFVMAAIRRSRNGPRKGML